MKLATYKDGSRDGQLVVVSRDLGTAHYATGIASKMQQVLDDWGFLSPQLQDLYDQLNSGRARHAFPFDPKQGYALPLDPDDGKPQSGNLMADNRAGNLRLQMEDASSVHLEFARALTPAQIRRIQDFELRIYTAQQSSPAAGGGLDTMGATGGPATLSASPLPAAETCATSTTDSPPVSDAAISCISSTDG